MDVSEVRETTENISFVQFATGFLTSANGKKVRECSVLNRSGWAEQVMISFPYVGKDLCSLGYAFLLTPAYGPAGLSISAANPKEKLVSHGNFSFGYLLSLEAVPWSNEAAKKRKHAV